MAHFWWHTAGNFYKIAVSLIGLAIVFYVLIEFRLWSMEWTGYFSRLGSIEEIIFISLVVAVVSFVVLRLFSWHLRLQTRRKR